MSNKIVNFYKNNTRILNGLLILIVMFIAIPYIEIIFKAIYTVGTIIGSYTRMYWPI